MDASDSSESTSKSLIDSNSKQIKVTADDFEFGKYLAKGSYGKVYYARKKTGKDKGTVLAMKTIQKNDGIITKPVRIKNIGIEKDMLANIKHPFIIKMYYAFEARDFFFFGLEYMPNGDLLNYLEKFKSKTLDRDTSCLYVSEIILALQYLHRNNIIFRDLKPENILVDAAGHVKLADFGLAKQLSSKDDQTSTFCGTLDYMAPEILKGKPYTRAVDWWGVGILLFDLLNGRPPFASSIDRRVTICNILSLAYSFKKTPAEDIPEAKDLIERLLKFIPSERLGAGPTDAEELMGHPFFKDIDFDDLLASKYKPLISRRDPPFKRVFRKTVPHNPHVNKSHEMFFEDFDYVAPSLLEVEEAPSDKTE